MLEYIKRRIALERFGNVVFFPIEKAINTQHNIDNKQKYAKILKIFQKKA